MNTLTLTVHQLLGRAVYFHVLFIEPALSQATAAKVAALTMTEDHQTDGSPDRCISADLAIDTSAWWCLASLADGLPAEPYALDPVDCACCQVWRGVRLISAAWVLVECGAYGLPTPSDLTLRSWSAVAADRVARVFQNQHGGACLQLGRHRLSALHLPAPHQLPVFGELLALWADPGQGPVVTWLNHCSDLDAIRFSMANRR